MGRRSSLGTAFSLGLLFIILVMLVIFFYTCSLGVGTREIQPLTKTESAEEPAAVPAEEQVEQVEAALAPVEEAEMETLTEEPAEQPAAVQEVQELQEVQEEQELQEKQEEQESQQEQQAQESQQEQEEQESQEEQEKPTTEEEIQVEQGRGVPEAPDLDWFTIVDLVQADSWASSYFGEDIDWSEFVSSDDEIDLPDGTYFAHVVVNGTRYGTVEFEQAAGRQWFSRADLEMELTGTLAEDYLGVFFADEGPLYSLEYLESVAESVRYDGLNLLLYLYFNSSQVPVQNISLSTSSYSLLRQSYDVVGNVVLEPARFSFQTNISVYASLQVNRDPAITGLSVAMSLSNTFSFWNMTFSLPVSLSYYLSSGFAPNIGSWSGYMDFPEENLRLSFGNVGNAGFTSGSPFGFTLEKSYGFGTGTALTNQYTQTITLTEDSFVSITVNGSSVFAKTLALGVYRLTDFVFTTGANEIVVNIHPLSMGEDRSEDQTLTFGQSYDTSLMAKGESVWRFGASIPKVLRQKGTGDAVESGFVVPAIPTYSSRDGWKRMESVFDFSGLSVFWDQTIGIAHSYTQNQSFSFVVENKGGEYQGLFGASVSGILATGIGTTRAGVNASLSSANPARNSFSVNVSQSFVAEALKPLSLSASYSLTHDMQMLSANTGYSLSLVGIRLGLSFSTSYRIPAAGVTIDKPWTWSGSLSVGTSFGKTGSFSVNASINQDMTFYATASFSYSIGQNSMNASVTTNNGRSFVGNAGWYYRPGADSRNNFQVNISGINFSSPQNHVLSASWSRSGDLFSLSVRQQASNVYTRFTTSLSFNTAIAFADGEFAMTNSLYGPFLIVSPQNSLKNATVSVASTASTDSGVRRKTFGNVLFTRLTMYKANNVVVFASNGSLFTSSGSFLFKLTPTARQGFLAKVRLEASIAVSGVLLHSPDSPYDSYSSPIYNVTLASDGVGVESIEIDNESYFFTDIDGRFILSDLKSGLYMIDLNVDGQWYAAFFEVPSTEDAGYVAIYKDFDASRPDALSSAKYDIRTFDDSYAGSVYLAFDKYMTEDEYWNFLFSLSNSGSEDEWDFDSLEDDWESWEDDWESFDDSAYDTSEYQEYAAP